MAFMPLPHRPRAAQTGLITYSAVRTIPMQTFFIGAAAVILGAVMVRTNAFDALARAVVRGLRAFRAAQQAQVQLQERYLRAQRPWQAEWLHWEPSGDGWRLAGRVLPPARIQLRLRTHSAPPRIGCR
jgi:hypothetical protein